MSRLVLFAVLLSFALVAAPAASADVLSDGAFEQPKAKAAKLTVASVARTVKRNRWVRIRVRLSNTGNAAARKLTLVIGRARGVEAQLRGKRVRRLAPGATATATVRVRLSRKAARRVVLRLHAKAAGKLTASGRITLRVAPKRKPEARRKGPLAGRQFWGTVSHVDWAWDNRGVYFVDDAWAYEGLPKGGLPRCTAVTEELDANGKPEDDGCRRYSYNAKTGSLTVGNLRGTYKAGRLTLDEVGMEELDTPRPDTRLQVDLLHRSFSGLCGLILGCTTSLETLITTTDGQFARGRSTTSTMGDGVSTPFVALGNYPADEHGTYEILANGAIRLSYADGSVKTHTIGIFRDDKGRPDAVKAGVLLDDTNFYTEDD